MTTLAAGASINLSIPAGNTLRVNGSGVVTINNQMQGINNAGVFGPFPSALTAYLTATTALDYAVDPPLARVLIVSPVAPYSNDGRPDGTVYIQSAS